MLLIPLAMIGLGCAGSLTTYDDVIRDARACSPADQCAIAGGVMGCRCPMAVRADAVKRVQEATLGARCPQIERLYCPPVQHPRCERSVCVADEVRE